MNFDIITVYPGWFIIACILSGLSYALALYYKNRTDEFSRWLTRALALFRFVTVFLLSFLILSPLVKTVTGIVEKPVIVLLQDNSSSIIQDEMFNKGSYLSELNGLVSELREDFQVDLYSFGENLEVIPGTLPDTGFDESSTNISMAIDEVQTLYENRNIGAILLASDGIYNRGMNPVYSTDFQGYPLFAIALGDTAQKRDLLIRNINHNSIAYSGNDFPVEILLQAYNCNGEKTLLEIKSEGRTLFAQNISVSGKNYTREVQALIPAGEPGINPYTVGLRPVGNEVSIINNQKAIYIDVLDARQKILILARSPHPDVSALKEIIRSNRQFEAEDFLIENFTGNISEYNLVILHQLPSSHPASFRIVEELKRAEMPVLYILGKQSDINLFNGMASGLLIDETKGSFNEVQPHFNSDFILFQLNDATKNLIPSLPPLLAPYGTYRFIPAMQIMFYQKVLSLVTRMPLLMLGQYGDRKTGVIAGEGIWRWRLKDFEITGTHDGFNEIFGRIIQYLAMDIDKKRFRIIAERRYLENENILFMAELYDENYEFLPGREISLSIIDENGRTYEFTFDKSDDVYVLDAGKFAHGVYRYRAIALAGENPLMEEGSFSVGSVDFESLSSTANHRVLYQLAQSSGGKMLFPDEMNKIPEMLLDNESIRPVVYSREKYTELVNLPWVLTLLILLLSLEWYGRKWGGSY